MLTLKIGVQWEARDFIEVLRSVDSFYYKGSLRNKRDPYDVSFWLEDHYYSFRSDGVPFETALDYINQQLLERARYETPSDQRLTVRRIRYASPGGIDLLGVGKVVEIISNSIGRVRVYYDERHLRRERDAQAALDTELRRLQ